ncbi:Aminopeptidase N [Orchesella cincta]|uniref:Aminopeptidase N n=1 Tax=Orchesella cincta TaxID=48709 RepID=A0A1D2M851_ORCCI|nr:Aminopeptidase N [Orchesella cincta]
MRHFFVPVLYFIVAVIHVDAAKDFESFISTSKKLSEEVETREFDDLQDLFFIPSHYEIEARFIFENTTNNVESANRIQSKIRIFGETQANAKWLALHALGLNLNTSSIQVLSQSGPLAIKEIDHEFTEFYSRVLIYFENEVMGATPLEISMEYNANPDKWLHVKSADNKTELLVNVLQSNYREYSSACSTMFPCFGSGVKSTFNLTIIRAMPYNSVTNGDIVSNSLSNSQIDGYAVEKYTWSTAIPPAMLTFALFSNNISCTERPFGKDEKPMRICAAKEDISKQIFGHTAYYTSQIMNFYEEYFGTSARVPKLEIFFVPGQSIKFESWGINVYGYTTEDGINLIPTAAGLTEKTNAYMIRHITQGLAKQWVGSWWDPEQEFILSESYPRYIEYLGLEVADVALADFAVSLDFLETDIIDKLSAKTQLESSNKGALLIRSFEGILNRDGVRRAVRLFLKHLWGENDETDYLDLNEMVAGNYTWSDIVKVLVGFMEKEGVPLVKLSVANQTHFAIKQETYLKNEQKEVKEEDADSDLWLLPFTYTQDSKGSEQNITWLSPQENLTFVEGYTNGLILANPTATGYHRTFYEDSILLKIQNHLESNHGSFKPLARARLVLDYFSFAEQSHYSAALNLTRYLMKEDSLVVWTAFLDKFTKIYSRFLSHPQYSKLEDFLLPKVDYQLEQIDDPSKFEEALLREKLLFVSCRLERRNKRLFKPPYCQTYSQKLYREWATNSNGVNPLDSIFPKTLRPILECAIVAFGGMEAFEFMYGKYHEMRLNGETYLGTLSSLACAQEKDVLEHLLLKTLQPNSSKGFAERDAWYLLNYLIDTPLPFGRAMMLPFLTKHFDEVVDKIGGGYSSIIPQLVRYLSEYLSTSEQRNEVETFVKMYQSKLTNSSDTSTHLNQAFEIMDANIQWMNTYGQDILNWMNQQ